MKGVNEESRAQIKKIAFSHPHKIVTRQNTQASLISVIPLVVMLWHVINHPSKRQLREVNNPSRAKSQLARGFCGTGSAAPCRKNAPSAARAGLNQPQSCSATAAQGLETRRGHLCGSAQRSKGNGLRKEVSECLFFSSQITKRKGQRVYNGA